MGNVLTDSAVNPTTTKCTPLEINGLYRVAVNNYIAAGGSGFFVLKRNTSQQDTGVSLRDSLTVFLTKQANTCDGVDVHNIMDANGKSVFDNYGNIACLDDKVEAHDGRIRPVTR
jgi:2',3'-cyclic-nucleotide 2'-phosphodiesterase (5'-nucleotidase family)